MDKRNPEDVEREENARQKEIQNMAAALEDVGAALDEILHKEGFTSPGDPRDYGETIRRLARRGLVGITSIGDPEDLKGKIVTSDLPWCHGGQFLGDTCSCEACEAEKVKIKDRHSKAKIIRIGGRYVDVEKWDDGEFKVHNAEGDKIGHGTVTEDAVEWDEDKTSLSSSEAEDVNRWLMRVDVTPEFFGKSSARKVPVSRSESGPEDVLRMLQEMADAFVCEEGEAKAERNPLEDVALVQEILEALKKGDQLQNAVCDLLSELRIDERCLMVMADGYSPDYPGGKWNRCFRFDESGQSPQCKVQLSKVVATKLVNAGLADQLKEDLENNAD